MTIGDITEGALESAAPDSLEEATARAALTGLELADNLAAHVLQCWEDARQAKNAVLPRLQSARRARLGEYDPAKLAEIRKYGGSEVYSRVTANKCRILEAWLRDVYLGQADKPWSLEPSPIPEMPPGSEDKVKQQIAQEAMNVQQLTGEPVDQVAIQGAESELLEQEEQRLRDAARKAVGRMERQMEDQLVEGGFNRALIEFLCDFPVYPAALLKGPTFRMRQRLAWVADVDGKKRASVSEAIVPEWERVDPFRAYPAPGAETPQDGYFIEHLTLSYTELWDWIGAPGVNEKELREALQEAEDGGLDNWLGFQTDSDHGDTDDIPRSLRRKVYNIDVLLFYGPIQGQDLLDWGVEDEIEDPDESFEACVWLVGRHVIKAHLNYDPMKLRPYFKASYENIPGDFWGFGIPDVLEDIQSVTAAATRALVNNVSIASGPQVAYDISRLPRGENLTALYPWKIWQVTDPVGSGGNDPVKFFQPAMNARELMEVIERFYTYADDFSLIPRYMAGADKVGGAGRTASGLSMLMDAANKGLKGVVSNIDTDIFTPLLQRLYNHNMEFNEDETLKGDAQVVSKGAISLMQMEALQLRRNEFLQATANPIDSQIVGPEGRAEILREVAKGLELDTSRIVPSREELEAQAEQAQQMAMGGMPGGPPGAPGGPPGGGPGGGAPPGGVPGMQPPAPSQDTLDNGAAMADLFSQGGA